MASGIPGICRLAVASRRASWHWSGPVALTMCRAGTSTRAWQREVCLIGREVDALVSSKIRDKMIDRGDASHQRCRCSMQPQLEARHLSSLASCYMRLRRFSAMSLPAKHRRNHLRDLVPDPLVCLSKLGDPFRLTPAARRCSAYCRSMRRLMVRLKERDIATTLGVVRGAVGRLEWLCLSFITTTDLRCEIWGQGRLWTRSRRGRIVSARFIHGIAKLCGGRPGRGGLRVTHARIHFGPALAQMLLGFCSG